MFTQLQSELNVPRRIAQEQLSSSEMYGFVQLQYLIESIQSIIVNDQQSKFFFLGIGTSIPLLTAIKTCSDNSVYDAKFIACTNHQLPFLSESQNQLLAIQIPVAIPFR